MRRLSADVVVIGGGIAGASTALALARRGRRVVLLERWLIGAEASGRNAGGVRQQGRLPAEIPLARRAVKIWETLDASLGRPTGYRQCGHVYVAENETEMEALAEQHAQERQHGLDSELISPQQLRALAPGIAHGLTGAKFCATDGMADPAQATLAIAQAAEEAGATLFCHQQVTAIGLSNGRVTHVDTAARVVSLRDKPVELTAREYSLVEFMALHRGEVVTRTQLYEHLFDENESSLSNLLDVHVSNVRKKLGAEFIATRRGHGYCIE